MKHPVVVVRATVVQGGQSTVSETRWLPRPLKSCRLFTRRKYQRWRFIEDEEVSP